MGTVTFAPGARTAFIDIHPINDSEFEDPETVILTLVNSSAYQIGNRSSATVTIWDNDLPVVTIEATDAEAAETNPGQTPNPGRFTLTRTGSTTHALTVKYSIGGTAIGGTDYTIGGTSTSVNFTNRMGTVTFAAGASTVDILVNPIDDTLKEGLETVVLTLASDPNYQIGTSNTATVNIIDNEDNIVSGTLRADTFTFTPGYLRTVFIGNGNVDYGAGRRDEIDLSTVSYGTVTFNLANTNGGGVVFDLGNGNHRIFDALTLNDGKEILFEGIERIRFADRTLDLSVTPNDPLFNQQWNLHMIGVHHAWRFTTGSSNVLIGIQDSGLGVDSQNDVHQEIDIRRTTFLPSNYRDEFAKTTSHGTAVQGIIAAKSNNGSGIAGINWNSNVFHIDVLHNHDGNDLSLHDAAQKMINEANRLGQRLVINMSLSSSRSSFGENLHPDLEGVVSKNPNVLFVISSGNEGHLGRSGIASPAFLASKYKNVMAVGAVYGPTNSYGQKTTPGTRTYYSQYGTGLTLMAPSEVLTTIASNATGSVTFDYDRFNGTSAAAPHVTGVASLIWSVNPNLTAAQLKTIMSETAYKGVPDYSKDYYGSGVVNADAAVRRAMAMARGSA
jgi:subtilisin family serine protease